MENKNKIQILKPAKIVSVSHGSTLLDSLLAAKVPISHSCGGFGTCGTCLVKVKDGLEHWPPRNEIEMEMAQDRQFSDSERLACQCEVNWSPEEKVSLEILSLDHQLAP